jgi:hypothetical protein
MSNARTGFLSYLRIGYLLIPTFIGHLASADVAPFKDGVGAVDLKFIGKCASDLFYNGKVLLPTEACQLALDKKIDLSRLEPDPSTTVLSPQDPSQWLWRPPQDASADVIAYKNPQPEEKKNPLYGYYNDLKAMKLESNGETLEFVSPTETSLGRYAIIAKKQIPSANGQTETKYFEIRMDLKGHNFLLRKTLLRKIGYQVPFMDRLATVKIKFSNEFDLVSFVQALNNNTLLDPSRWIVDNNVDLLTIKNADEAKQAEIDEKTKEIRESLTLNMIDVIAIDGMNDRTLNLGRGRLTSDIIQGRRALNSLLVPFSLVDVPESINIFDNSMCDVFNQQLYLSYEYGVNPDGENVAFNPPYEDARWIARKILELNRNDWVQIVNSGKMPDEVSSLLLEKLISRRNCLRNVLNLDTEGSGKLSVNLQISFGARLKEGKLVGSEKWEGYSRQFSGNDADAPQSKSELFAYAKSQLIYNLIRNVVFKFNQDLPKTDIKEKEFDRDLDLAVWQFGEFIKTKKVPKIPRKIYPMKYYNVFAYPDRDIIAGTYLGSDNQVQIADSLTLGLDVGYALRGEGLPPKMALRGQAKMNLIKSWVHIKPLSSMKLGLKEPFKNIMVPYFMNRAQKPLHGLLSLETEYDQIAKALAEEKDEAKIEELKNKSEDWSRRFKERTKQFNSLFGPNESVIVSSSFGPDISLLLAKGVTDVAALVAQVRTRFVDLSRMNIVRKGNDKFQLYFDPTLYGDLRLALGLEAHGVPLVQFDWSWKKGVTTTHFFEYNIDSTLVKGANGAQTLKNKDFFNSIRTLSAALKGATKSHFERQQTPTKIEHDFKDFEFGFKTVDIGELLKFRLGNFRYQSESTTDKIKVTTPDGREANYVRVTDGFRKGSDYLNLIVNITGALLKDKYPDLQINVQDNGDASNSPGGRAISRHVVVESEVTPQGLNLSNLLANARYVWKGWSKSAESTQKTFDEMSQLFGLEIFKRPDLGTTKEVQFYNLAVNVSLYREALQNIMTKSDKEIDELFAEYGTEPVPQYEQFDRQDAWATYLKNKIKSLNRNLQKDPKKAAESLADIMSVLQSKLDFKGFIKICGGIQNIFIQGNMAGFRVGDQRMTNPKTMTLTAPTYGQIGNYEPMGPLSTILSKTGIANGELFISWLLSPL